MLSSAVIYRGAPFISDCRRTTLIFFFFSQVSPLDSTVCPAPFYQQIGTRGEAVLLLLWLSFLFTKPFWQHPDCCDSALTVTLSPKEINQFIQCTSVLMVHSGEYEGQIMKNLFVCGGYIASTLSESTPSGTLMK